MIATNRTDVSAYRSLMVAASNNVTQARALRLWAWNNITTNGITVAAQRTSMAAVRTNSWDQWTAIMDMNKLIFRLSAVNYNRSQVLTNRVGEDVP